MKSSLTGLPVFWLYRLRPDATGLVLFFSIIKAGIYEDLSIDFSQLDI